MGTVVAICVAVLIAALVAYAVSYNRLIRDRQAVADSWSVIDAELQRRHELIPGLVESVRAAAAHERDVLDDLVAKERTAAQAGRSAAERSEPEHDLGASTRTVVGLRERYPELNAQQNFLALQKELALTEDRIGAARRFYNMKVAELNRRTEAFPSSLIAQRHGIDRAAYFDPD